MTIFTKRFEKGFPLYSFACCITYILGLCSFNQMLWANTLRSVASVHQVFSPISLGQEPCDVMSIKLLPFSEDSAIANLCNIANPEPTGIGLINVPPKGVLEGNSLWHAMEILPQAATDVTSKAPCDETLWKRIYQPKRLVVKQACISVIGTLVDASHGRNKDGCRHEADGDCHTWLKLEPVEEGLLNDKNRSNEDGNLVIEPICRYRVTQTDAIQVCKGWHQNLVLPPPGSRVRVTGAYVLDTQHGHMEIHPVSAIKVLGAAPTG